MTDNYGNREEAESWFYSYEGWASKKREEALSKELEFTKELEFIGSNTNLESDKPEKVPSDYSQYTSQSYLNAEGDLLEVEQVGSHITLKVYKGGIMGQVTRLNLSPKEARTLIMMLAVAVEGGPYSAGENDSF